MKRAKDQETIHTIPDGAYECGVSNQELQKENLNPLRTPATDEQGNGYPVSHFRTENGH